MKLKDFFPKKVYHCPCASFNIKLCLVNGDYCLKNICNKLNQHVGDKLYCARCGDQDVIFSCRKHMAMVVFSQKMHDGYIELTEQTENCCLLCIKKYLERAYHCCYDYVDFNLPMTIKKEKKTLCLCLRKI